MTSFIPVCTDLFPSIFSFCYTMNRLNYKDALNFLYYKKNGKILSRI